MISIVTGTLASLFVVVGLASAQAADGEKKVRPNAPSDLSPMLRLFFDENFGPLGSSQRAEATRIAIGKLDKEPKDFSNQNLRGFHSEAELLSTVDQPLAAPFLVYKQSDSDIYFVRFSSDALMEATLGRTGVFVEGTRKLDPGSYPGDPADGHDYRLLDLGRVFSVAEEKRVTLNPMEIRLRDSLLSAGLLQKYRDEGSKKYIYLAVKPAAIVAIGTSRRRASASHELNHAVYFMDSAYRKRVKSLFESGLNSDEKQLVEQVFKFIDRNGSSGLLGDHELMLTEFAAYFRDPDELWDSYLKRDFPRSRKMIDEIARKLKSLEKTVPFYKPHGSPSGGGMKTAS